MQESLTSLCFSFLVFSCSHLRILQIWCDLVLLHGPQSWQLSFLKQPGHSPQRFLFFLAAAWLPACGAGIAVWPAILWLLSTFIVGRSFWSVGQNSAHTLRSGTQLGTQFGWAHSAFASKRCVTVWRVHCLLVIRLQKIWSNELQIERSKNQKIGEIEEHTIKNHIKTIFSAATISCFP